MSGKGGVVWCGEMVMEGGSWWWWHGSYVGCPQRVVASSWWGPQHVGAPWCHHCDGVPTTWCHRHDGVPSMHMPHGGITMTVSPTRGCPMVTLS